MDFPGGHITYRYSPNERPHRSIADDWTVDQYDVDVSSSFDYDASTSSLVPMHRFMGDCDFPLFNFTTQPNNERLPPFQSLDIAPYAHPASSSWPYAFPPEIHSPSLSGPSSSYFSSNASERQETPTSPPDTSFGWSPEIVHPDQFGFAFGGGHDMFQEQKPAGGHSCVALHQVQSYEDPQPEKVAYEDDAVYYGSYASAPHEGYQPVEMNGDATDVGVDTDDNDSKDDDYVPQSPNIRRRRPQVPRSVTSPKSPSKVMKRGHARRSSAPAAKPASNGIASHTTTTNNRAFPCALSQYGCTSTFGSKNEWKRHVNTQHMRLAYWRCDQCDCSNKRPNDFNRKDLFIQHVRRMHPIECAPAPKKPSKQSAKNSKGGTEEQTLNTIAERCLMHDRSPPARSGCHFCDATFEITSTGEQGQWDKRLEHVAQHMEAAKKTDDTRKADPSTWKTDARLERWLLDNGIVEPTPQDGLRLI